MNPASMITDSRKTPMLPRKAECANTGVDEGHILVVLEF